MEKTPSLEKPEENLESAVLDIHSGESLVFNKIIHSEIVIESGAKLTVHDLIESKIVVRQKGKLEVLGTWTDCDIRWE
jgi:hypothetical protein